MWYFCCLLSERLIIFIFCDEVRIHASSKVVAQFFLRKKIKGENEEYMNCIYGH